MKRYLLYIETKIKCDLETFGIFRHKPSAHLPCDLRIPEIEYLPIVNSTANKKFLCSTIISYGIKIITGYDYQSHLIVPEKLHEVGYSFKYRSLETALKNILNNEQ